jgi:hypothetical protein
MVTAGAPFVPWCAKGCFQALGTARLPALEAEFQYAVGKGLGRVARACSPWAGTNPQFVQCVA